MMLQKSINHKESFLLKFFQEPQKIGSIVPSSSFLVENMTKDIDWQKADVIVELGAGTGIITDTIFHKKKALASVIVAEQDLELQAILKDKYQDFTYIGDAQNFVDVINGIEKRADYIICSLPFSIWPNQVVEKYLADIAANLAEGGEFIMFQYSPYIYRSLTKYFSSVKVSVTLLNLPPAIVYKCKNASAVNKFKIQ